MGGVRVVNKSLMNYSYGGVGGERCKSMAGNYQQKGKLSHFWREVRLIMNNLD